MPDFCGKLKKEGRRNEFEMHKLLALNQRQKMVKHLSFKILYEVVTKSPLTSSNGLSGLTTEE